jgi:hypothetical protein
MTNEAKVLNSRESIPAKIAPTGVRYGVFRLSEHPLFEVYAVRLDEEDKEFPDLNRKQPVEGNFTSEAKANEALRKFLTLAWAASDEAAGKLLANREKRKEREAA